MRRSTERILTTHAGSLPNLSEPPPSGGAELSAAVTGVVSRQRQIGLDLGWRPGRSGPDAAE